MEIQAQKDLEEKKRAERIKKLEVKKEDLNYHKMGMKARQHKYEATYMKMQQDMSIRKLEKSLEAKKNV